MKQYNIIVEVHSRVGGFQGRINEAPIAQDTAIRARNEIQNKINALSTLTLYTNNPDEEITLPGRLIQNSVFKFRIVEVLV